MGNALTILLGTPKATTPWAEAVRPLVDGYRVHVDETASSWPFRRTVVPAEDVDGPLAIVIPALQDAFPAQQFGPAQHILTQSTYQLQRWLDWLDAHPSAVVVGVASKPFPGPVWREAREQRGPWTRLRVVEVAWDQTPSSGPVHPLHRKFDRQDATRRYKACRAAADNAPTDPALLLALACASMETGRRDEWEEALTRAAAVAADWEAVHYELGKLWLRCDETERAAAAFAEAARLMPTFAAAHANMGAALGELERPAEALVALERAVRLDPFGPQIHNNIGASLRDLGRLPEAEASFRQVLALAPRFVFGHYNLGHVLFLQGRFDEARDAYETGLARDPLRTPRQRLRLALTLAALGEEAPATTHAREALNDTPAERRAELLDEMAEVLEALAALHGERRPGIRALEQVAGDYRAITSITPRN